MIYNVGGQRIYYGTVKTERLIVPIPRQGIYLVKVLPENGAAFNGKVVVNF